MLTPKERFLNIFNHQTNERVPTFVQGVKEGFISRSEEELFDSYEGELIYNLQFDAALVLGFDAVFADIPNSVHCPGVEMYLEEVGETVNVGMGGRYKLKDYKNSAFYQRGALTTLERHEAVWENVKFQESHGLLQKTADYYNSVSDKIFPVPKVAGLFDTIWLSMGMRQFAREYRKRTKFYRKVIEDYAEVVKYTVEQIIEATGDAFGIITILDDVAFKGAPMISPERWEQDFLPYYKEITQIIHDAGMPAMLHTDGDVTEILPSFIKAGFDGLQGWEGGTDPYFIADNFPEFVVVGFGDVHQILPFGTHEEIEAHVKELMDALKPNGHYICGPSTVIFKEIPYSNAAYFMEMVHKYGKYT